MLQRRDFIRFLTAGAAAIAGCKAADPAGVSEPAPDAATERTGEGDASAAGPSSYSGGDGYSDGQRDAGNADCAPTTRDVEGPFFEAGAPKRTRIAAADEPGERLHIEGTVVDDDCKPIASALLDIWQADKDGNYHDAGTEFRLRGQLLTDGQGRYAFDTIVPGNYPIAANAWRPAHIHFMVSKPGYRPLTTQLYFEGDPYLPPNDGCTGCGSDDPARIIARLGSAESGWSGQFRIALARA